MPSNQVENKKLSFIRNIGPLFSPGNLFSQKRFSLNFDIILKPLSRLNEYISMLLYIKKLIGRCFFVCYKSFLIKKTNYLYYLLFRL